MWHLLCVVMFLSFLFLFFLFSCSRSTLWKAHLGYLHCVRASSRCFNSSFSSGELEQTALALCVRVLITLYLQARLWWLSHCRYWSVWVGFLYTLVVSVPSSWGVTKMSKKGMEPFLILFLCGKLYGWIHRVYVLQELFFLILLQNDKCVIHKPFPPSGGSLQLIWLCPQNTPYINCPAQGSQEIPWLPPGFAHSIDLETGNKYCTSKTQAGPGCFGWT